MAKFFQVAGAALTVIGVIGIIALVFNVGIDPNQYGMITTWGAVESTLLLGIVFRVLYLVTEMTL